ncbi:MAG: hypothetical protein HZA28_02415 [Candidatus Omnitrophica bacterium]|nr:hypothetical protein [Candidatus Omnitrophota bacterium]
MQSLKVIVLAASLLLFASLSSAEMTAMSLQERMRQSNVVVVGTIEEVHQTDAGVGGQFPPPVTHWLATCRVDRYIIGPKIHNPDVEEAKAVSLIRIAFEQKFPKSTPTPMQLVEGRKYLLFLREISAQGERLYEMITPYHGAFEAGQDHFIHDEQSPEYPKAVKMSFDEIVRHVSPSDESFVDTRDQINRELSEDELRMKERLITLSRGEGAVADLQMKVRDGGAMTIGESGIYHIANGKIVSQKWDGIALPVKRQERVVTDEEVRKLLRQLIEHEYWTFQGTQFIVDASSFMFRFHYKDMPPVEYYCDAQEYEPSAQLSAIRSAWLSFVSGASPQDQPSCEARGGHWGRFGLMAKDQCNLPTSDAGRQCSDHGECESDCIAEDSVPAGTETTGKCFGWTVTLGRCMNGVEDGKAQGTICAD